MRKKNCLCRCTPCQQRGKAAPPESLQGRENSPASPPNHSRGAELPLKFLMASTFFSAPCFLPRPEGCLLTPLGAATEEKLATFWLSMMSLCRQTFFCRCGRSGEPEESLFLCPFETLSLLTKAGGALGEDIILLYVLITVSLGTLAATRTYYDRLPGHLHVLPAKAPRQVMSGGEIGRRRRTRRRRKEDAGSVRVSNAASDSAPAGLRRVVSLRFRGEWSPCPTLVRVTRRPELAASIPA